jgi:hypothetical protein
MAISYIGAMPQGAEALIKRFSSTEVLRAIIICNNSGADQTYELKFVPKDTPSTNGMRVFYNNPIRVGETVIIQMYDLKLEDQEEIIGLATGDVNICLMRN